MTRTATLLAACATALAWATPAAALECTDVQALLDAQVTPEVTQRIVFTAPPADGWACLDGTEHTVADLEMAHAYARLPSAETLRWSLRFRQCEASQSMRTGARRLFRDKESTEPVQTAEPETSACQEAFALLAAIRADDEAHAATARAAR